MPDNSASSGDNIQEEDSASHPQNRSSLLSSTSETIDDWQRYLQESRIIFNDRVKKKFHNRGDITLKDFKQYYRLGEGTYGKVMAVINTKGKRSYAMKILNKHQIIKLKQVEHTFNEKRVLQAVSFPFLIQLKYFYMDRYNLYFVMSLGNRGELFKILWRMKTFPEELARFYGGQVILALEYLHFLNVVYRDIKPENIVVCENGYIKLTDFGFCKILDKGRTYSFCGTPEYMAPEIVKHKGYGKSVDWWGLGILLYEMMIGNSPFKSGSFHHTYAKILTGKVRFPRKFNHLAKDLIKHLLDRDLSRRWGNLKGGVEDIKNHPWFKDLDWMKLLNQTITPPHIPPVEIPQNKKFLKSSIASESYYDKLFKDF